MRATVSFEVEVERVPETMRCLVLEESHILNGAIETLESVTAESLGPDLASVLGHLRQTTHQLEQYQAMLLGFERARLESLTPPAAPEEPVQPDAIKSLSEARTAVHKMKKFDNFISQMQPSEEHTTDSDEIGEK